MRVIVTGAAGFIGSWLAESLHLRGHEVLGLDDLSGGNNPVPCRFAAVDLRDRGAVGPLVSDMRPDALVHLAANAREGASQFQPHDVVSRNLQAYTGVLEPCIRAGVRKVVLFSSMAVYGAQRAPFDEALERRPVDVYGVCKAAMEQVTEILSAVHGFRYVILRPHNVFGERQNLADRFRNVIAIFMNRIMRGEPVQVYGDGNQRRAFSYVLNSLPSYVNAVEGDLHREIVNVGGTEPVTVNGLLDLVAEAMSVRPEIVHLPDRALEVKEAWCSHAKSSRLLGYSEKFTLMEGIRRMAAWARACGPREWSREALDLAGPRLPSTWA